MTLGQQWRWVIARKTTLTRNYISTKIAGQCGFSNKIGTRIDIKLELCRDQLDCSVYVKDIEQDLLLTEALLVRFFSYKPEYQLDDYFMESTVASYSEPDQESHHEVIEEVQVRSVLGKSQEASGDTWSLKDQADQADPRVPMDSRSNPNPGIAFPQDHQPSDSGYGTAQYSTSKTSHAADILLNTSRPFPSPIQEHERESSPELNDPSSPLSEDRGTVYTAAMSLTDPRLANHMNYLVDDISNRLATAQLGGTSIRRLVNTLPGALKTFALGLGYGAPSQAHRDVMVFIHKFRSYITDTFNEHNNKEYDEVPPKHRSDAFTTETLNRWLHGEDNDQYDPLPVDSDIVDDFAAPDVEQDLDLDIPGIDRYIDIVCQDPMYEWLLAKLRRDALLVRADPNVMGEIRDEVLRWLPSDNHISRHASFQARTVEYNAEWQLFHFLREQDYEAPAHEAILGVVTLTGTHNNAQAATCLEYMSQTWPLTGPQTLQLIQKLLEGPENTARLEISKPSALTLEAEISQEFLNVRVSGLADFVAEIGEQLSWLGAVMQVFSDDSCQIAECTPRIHCEKTPNGSALDLMCVISFPIVEKPTTPTKVGNGQCWHRMFHRPVVAKGFPIPQRPLMETGLEMTLSLMAALTRSRYINIFQAKTFLKGFSAMLVPTKISNDKDIVYWHMVSSKHPEQRISYMDSHVETTYVSKTDLSRARHILGWCEEVVMTIGTSRANYKVSRSQLPKPRAGCALEKIEVSGGQFVTGTAAFAIGRREKPCSITRHGYFKKLQWISSKYVVFWDDVEKRGWLVNGASALLHLLQATIGHSRDIFQSEFLMKPGDLDEDIAATDCQRALRILTKKENRAIRLYMDRTEESAHQIGGNVARSSSDKYYYLQDEVEHIFNTLEVLIDYQAEAESRSGLKIDPRPRRYLEGWDFKDIVSDGDPFYPRVATLSYFGKGWVDLTRSIRATTIFGRGFGELMQPKMAAGTPCSLWTTLPCGSYYLAAGVSDVKNIIERYDGDVGVNPIKICDGILWPVKTGGFRSCPCGSKNGREKHHEPVQALLPSNFLTKLKQRTPVELADRGAVIFGQSRSISWVYPDEGDPVKGDSSLPNANGESSSAQGSQSSIVPGSSSPSTQSSRDLASTALSTMGTGSLISTGSGMRPSDASQTKLYAGVKRGLQSSLSTVVKRVKGSG
ncbi:hypothetical protein PG990_010537 [Apiospora arundinis]